MAYWLIKTEPTVFSIDDLAASPGQTTYWDGVRNYQARNFIRDDMRPGDEALFYHSNCPETGVAGTVCITSEPYADPTALDRRSKYYDPKSTTENPRWFVVDVKLKRKLDRVITLAELKEHAENSLREFALLKRGNRLSVMPVSKQQWDFILGLE